MLDTHQLQIQAPSHKFASKRLGPHLVEDVLGNGEFRLKLLAQWKQHPIFHVSQLLPFKGTVPTETELIIIEDAEEVEVDNILASRKSQWSVQYLVAWKGYPEYENSWVKARNCANCMELVKVFHKSHPDAPCPLQKVVIVMAIRLPKAHKDVALVQFPRGGALPLEKGKGNVSPGECPLAIDWALLSFLSKKVLKRKAVPLVTHGDLTHVVDKCWVTALLLWIPPLVPTLTSAELLWGISEICAEITEMKLIETKSSGR